MTRRFSVTPEETRILVLAGCIFAFAAADVVTGGPLTHLDGQIRAAVQPRPPATPAWLGIPGALGDVGPAAAVLAIAGLVCAQALWRMWPLALAVANFVTAEVSVLLLKTAVGRPGPGEAADRINYPGYFPSGHTATAAVVTGTVVFLAAVAWKPGAGQVPSSRIALICGLGMGLLAAVRAVLGDFHWASDGLGGLALATVVLVAGMAAARTFGAASATAADAPARE